MAKHRHKWLPYFGQALGYWEKRQCPGDGLYFKGRAEVCADSDHCHTLRFICDDPRYRIVEIEPLERAMINDGIVK
jgi:hypothetical protein